MRGWNPQPISWKPEALDFRDFPVCSAFRMATNMPVVGLEETSLDLSISMTGCVGKHQSWPLAQVSGNYLLGRQALGPQPVVEFLGSCRQVNSCTVPES